MAQDLETLLGGLREGKGPAILLLHGDEFRVRGASRAILKLVAPDSDQGLGISTFDGRAASWDEVEAALMTPSLFVSACTVVVENVPWFAPPERKAEPAEPSDDHKPVPGISKAEEPGRVLQLLEQGLPDGTRLLLLAPQVDKRGRAYKQLSRQGCVLDLSVERDRSGRIRRESLAAFLDQHLRHARKRIDPQAREALLSRCGNELWGVHQEIEKLLLYVGDAETVDVAAVEEIFTDQSESWVFDLTDSLGQKDAIEALGFLRRLMADGEYPLRVLGAIASQVRRLLSARQLLDNELARVWRPRMSYTEFQQRIPADTEGLPTRSPYANYLTLQRAERFTLSELTGFLRLMRETDARLKSSGHQPQAVMEGLILEMCRP